MKASLISTAAIAEARRSVLADLQGKLAKAEQELSTGRRADIGLDIGFRAGQSISLRSEFDRLTTIVNSNASTKTRLDVTQETLGQMTDVAESLLAALVASRNAAAGVPAAVENARSGLETLTDLMNTTASGAFIFAGINSDIEPLQNFFADPASPPKVQHRADYLAAFSATPDDADLSAISPAAMQSFLDGAFATQFGSASWTVNWSSASSEDVRTRISTSVITETSVNANEQAFRDLARALVMVTDTGGDRLSEATFDIVADEAIDVVGNAIAGLTTLRADVGTVQEQVTQANERIDRQIAIISTNIQDLESVDPFEAATRATTLLNQIEASYALTSRLQRLSLTNYL